MSTLLSLWEPPEEASRSALSPNIQALDLLRHMQFIALPTPCISRAYHDVVYCAVTHHILISRGLAKYTWYLEPRMEALGNTMVLFLGIHRYKFLIYFLPTGMHVYPGICQPIIIASALGHFPHLSTLLLCCVRMHELCRPACNCALCEFRTWFRLIEPACMQLSTQLAVNKEQATLLKQQLSQTTSALEESERHIEMLSSELTASKLQAKNLKSRVCPLWLHAPCSALRKNGKPCLNMRALGLHWAGLALTQCLVGLAATRGKAWIECKRPCAIHAH
jgi:hypothetical protein